MELPSVIEIPKDQQEERADKALSIALEGDISRAGIKELIKEGRFLKAGQAIKPSTLLLPGDLLVVRPKGRHSIESAPEAHAPEFELIYEDDHIIALNKPAGLVVHKGAGVHPGVLVDQVVATRPEMLGVGQEFRWGVVHRLDKDTSGVMIMAKTQDAYVRLVERFKEHSIHRIYLTIVRGNPGDDHGVINSNIRRHPKDRKKMTTVRQGGRRAITEWTALERFGELTLLEIKPMTGRTHQIRVHLGAFGMPVAGDKVYGKMKGKGGLKDPKSKSAIKLLGRQALHAAELGLDHPVSGKPMEFKGPMPNDMASALHVLRESNDGV